MSRGLSDFQQRNIYYSDGITTVLDPFWVNTCKKCGEVYWSCDCICKCPVCGCADAKKSLGGIPYEQIVAERGEPKINQSLSEFIRENQS